MYFDLLGNVPVLSIRREPLELRENRVLKRFFDIIFSLIFLCTIFPFVYIIIGIAIKISSPGPIFLNRNVVVKTVVNFGVTNFVLCE